MKPGKIVGNPVAQEESVGKLRHADFERDVLEDAGVLGGPSFQGYRLFERRRYRVQCLGCSAVFRALNAERLGRKVAAHCCWRTG